MLKRLAVNTGSNVAVLAVSIVITFVMTPVLVRNLGQYNYGLWEMLAALIGYAGILDLGLRPTISRFTSKYHAEGDTASLQRLFCTSLVFLTVSGALVGGTFIFWAIAFPHTLAPEGASIKPYVVVLFIVGVQMLALFPGLVAESILEGLQKYYLKNMVSVVKMTIGSTLILTFITEQNGLILLAAVSSAGLWVRNMIFFLLIMHSRQGRFRFRPQDISFQQLRELLRFGVKTLIQGVSYRIETATDSLVIGFILGPAMVPLYSIPANLVQYLRTLSSTMTHAFMPLFSNLSAQGQDEKIRRVYVMASKFMVGLILPMATGVVLLGPAFIEIWIGPEIGEHSQMIVLLLVLFLTLPFLNPFASRYLTAINRHGIFAKLAPISAIINLMLTIFLVHRMGIVGAALASLFAVLAFFPIYLVYTVRHLGIGVADYLRESILPALLPTLVMGVAVGFYRFEVALSSYFDLFVGIVIGAAVYMPLIWALGLSGVERAYILGRMAARTR
ncbi:MAG: oligosaccharide flippase family protein [Aquisalimonadaceae bacterium]